MASQIVALKPARLALFARRANAAHAEALAAANRAVTCAVEAGTALIEAKAALPHGDWEPWLKANVSFSERTARSYMRLARIVPTMPPAKRQRVADLSLREAVKAVSGTTALRVLHSSESDGWYSPADIVERTAAVMGRIDLDPAAHPDSPVQAKLAYRDRGLEKPWTGRVYLNPPYGRGIDDWIAKLVTEYERGVVTSAIALLPARTDAAWFRRLDQFPRAFIHGRLRFSDADTAAPFPSCVVYLGKNPRRFARVFDQIGTTFVALRFATRG